MGLNGKAEQPRHFLVIGPSGSGRTTVLDLFSGLGFVQVGGLYPDQLEAVIPALIGAQDTVAFSLNLSPEQTDIEAVTKTITSLKERFPSLKVLYLSAPEDVLVKRYMACAKQHPFERAGLQAAVGEESRLVKALKPLKDYEIDMHSTPLADVRFKIGRVLGIPMENTAFTVYLTSFGFAHGVPLDAELVFDMRFLKNPFYDENLRPMTGLDKPVRDYIFSFPQAGGFLEKWLPLIGYLLPYYQAEGRTRLTIAIGCTGGQHRSVCMTYELAEYLKREHPQIQVEMIHREQTRWPKREVSEQTAAAVMQQASCEVTSC